LPADWRCAGTTGYDAIVAITHLLVDPAGADPLAAVWADASGNDADFPAVVDASKRQVVAQLFRPEVGRLVRELRGLADVDATATAFTTAALERAVSELLVAFDVYRAYAGDEASARRLDAALARAAHAAPDVTAELTWLGRLLHARGPTAEAKAFAVRFEQTTGPVMAKGIEDTAFYRYHRLVALNEVGGDPGAFGSSVDDWHEHCLRLATDWPASMTTLSTHDTKRSEDVRARLLTLAEIPTEWRKVVERWHSLGARHEPPDPATEYLFWQTLVGAWPLSSDRLQQYLEKATREAKLHTSWTDPDDAYDQRVRRYAQAVLADAAIVEVLERWVNDVIRGPGESNALSQKLLQLTMPGVPDVYQGQELPDLSLVDPDNRRPVDYDRRRAALSAIDAGGTDDPKLLVTSRVLRLRRERPELFAGDYTPLLATGPAAEHCVAYRRGPVATGAIIVATRLPIGLAGKGGWAATDIDVPAGYVDTFTGRAAGKRLDELLATLPVALLVPSGG
jgi:(1->4)-alpha-D-glucan 1-alpha-D-glucosylmutase